MRLYVCTQYGEADNNASGTWKQISITGMSFSVTPTIRPPAAVLQRDQDDQRLWPDCLSSFALEGQFRDMVPRLCGGFFME